MTKIMGLIGMMLVLNDTNDEYKEWVCEWSLSLETLPYRQGIQTVYPCQILVHIETCWNFFNVSPIHRSLLSIMQSNPNTMSFNSCFIENSIEKIKTKWGQDGSIYRVGVWVIFEYGNPSISSRHENSLSMSNFCAYRNILK